jgi:hypothetical protein
MERHHLVETRERAVVANHNVLLVTILVNHKVLAPAQQHRADRRNSETDVGQPTKPPAVIMR